MSERPPLSPFWQKWESRANATGAWLRDHPIKTLIIALLWLGFVFLPQFVNGLWELFSDKPFVPSMLEWIQTLQVPQFSANWITAPVGFSMLAAIVALLVWGRHTEGGGIQFKGTGTVSTPDADLHAQCKNTIRLLQEDLTVHSGRADTNEAIFKAFKEKYAVAISLADSQALEIGRFVEVVRACTHDPKLDDPMPTIQWSILLKNRSVYRISLDGDVGPLFFEGHKLTEHKDVLENKVMGLYPDRDGSIVFEQRLSPSEVNLLRSLPNGKFEFDKVMLYAKGSDAEHVTSHRVVIFSRFRATLGRCSDERTQAAEELSSEVDSLKTKLREARLNLDHEKTAERKALIASWRASIAKAYRDYQDSGWSFTGLLATQDDYLSLTPNLSPEAKTAIEDAPHPDYDDVRRLVTILAEDIARIEREWGL